MRWSLRSFLLFSICAPPPKGIGGSSFLCPNAHLLFHHLVFYLWLMHPTHNEIIPVLNDANNSSFSWILLCEHCVSQQHSLDYACVMFFCMQLKNPPQHHFPSPEWSVLTIQLSQRIFRCVFSVFYVVEGLCSMQMKAGSSLQALVSPSFTQRIGIWSTYVAGTLKWFTKSKLYGSDSVSDAYHQLLNLIVQVSSFLAILVPFILSLRHLGMNQMQLFLQLFYLRY